MKNKRAEEIYSEVPIVSNNFMGNALTNSNTLNYARGNVKAKSGKQNNPVGTSSINGSLSPNEKGQKNTFFTRKAQGQHTRSLSKILTRQGLEIESQICFPNSTKNQKATSPIINDGGNNQKPSVKMLMMSTLGSLNNRSNSDGIFKPKNMEPGRDKGLSILDSDLSNNKFCLIEKVKGRVLNKVPYTPDRTLSLASITTTSHPSNINSHSVNPNNSHTLSQYLSPNFIISEDRLPSSDHTEKTVNNLLILFRKIKLLSFSLTYPLNIFIYHFYIYDFSFK